jgi:hypothetical protein
MTKTTTKAASIYPLPLDRKIAEATKTGRRYTPSSEEWRTASRYQRSQMTWPHEVLAQLAKERP